MHTNGFDILVMQGSKDCVPESMGLVKQCVEVRKKKVSSPKGHK